MKNKAIHNITLSLSILLFLLSFIFGVSLLQLGLIILGINFLNKLLGEQDKETKSYKSSFILVIILILVSTFMFSKGIL